MAKLGSVVAFLFILLAIPCYADPDFYLVMDSCKTMVGALFLNKEGVKVTDGDTYIMSCERHSKNIKCTTTFKGVRESENNIIRNYMIKIDYPKLLIITDENHADYIATNPSAGGAVVITRVVTENIIGSKICQGMYMTSTEMKDYMEIIKK